MKAGLSLRQAAACLGINHATISRAVADDEQLRRDVEIARTRATLHPLTCILREAGRNWKAAVWLLEHLSTVTYHEKTPVEKAVLGAEANLPFALRQEIEARILKEAKAELLARMQASPDPPAITRQRPVKRSSAAMRGPAPRGCAVGSTAADGKIVLAGPLPARQGSLSTAENRRFSSARLTRTYVFPARSKRSLGFGENRCCTHSVSTNRIWDWSSL